MQNLPTEAQEQQYLVQWLRINKIFCFAPVNENNTHKQNRHYAMIAEVKARAAGKLKGTSDLIVMLPNKLLLIELKRQRRKLKSGKLSTSHTNTSKEQLKFLETANTFDYAEARVCYGWEEAKEYIESHL